MPLRHFTKINKTKERRQCMNFAITPVNSSGISVSSYLPVEQQGRACWQQLPLGKEIEQLGDQEGGWLFITCLWYSVQFSSVTQSCTTLCDPMDCSTPGLPVHHQLLEYTQLTSIESVMPSKHLILCHPLLLLPSIFPRIRVFQMSQFFASGG